MRVRAGGAPPARASGICASAATGRARVSTIERLFAFDLRTDALLWERPYDGGCDRMSVAPNGATVYTPSLEGPFWSVVDAGTGDVRRASS